MGKTTNILDLNNRLTKVEKENVAQNNYNSLKNRPKINGNLLTGDKTGAQLGLAEAQDIGDLSNLTTTDKSSCVAAINEVVSGLTNLIVSDIKSSDSQSIAGMNDSMFTIDVTKQGYTPIFYTTTITGNSSLVPYYYALSGNTLSVALHNFDSDAHDGTVNVLVLYKRN